MTDGVTKNLLTLSYHIQSARLSSRNPIVAL